MEIKTKYNLGDIVCLLSDNKVSYYPIDMISINITNSCDIDIKYRINNCGICEWRTEDKLFPTKEELLKSL